MWYWCIFVCCLSLIYACNCIYAEDDIVICHIVALYYCNHIYYKPSKRLRYNYMTTNTFNALFACLLNSKETNDNNWEWECISTIKLNKKQKTSNICDQSLFIISRLKLWVISFCQLNVSSKIRWNICF